MELSFVSFIGFLIKAFYFEVIGARNVHFVNFFGA